LASDLDINLDQGAEVRACSAQLAAADAPRSPSAAAPAAPAAEAQQAGQLRMSVRASYLPDIPVLVRVQVEDPSGQVDRGRWDDVVQLSADDADVTLSQTEVRLVNGMGSALVNITGSSSFLLTARLARMSDSRQLQPLPPSNISRISGVLSGDQTRLSGVVRVTGDLTVPATHVLTVEAGTLILIDGVPQTPQVQLGTRIIVAGTLNAQGTADEPITFTASDTSRPWGEIDVDGGSVSLEYTQIMRAGSSTRGGHTNSGPALRMHAGGTIQLDHSSVTDISGKILQSSSGTLNIADSLLSRAVMGPEITDTSLDLRDTWIIEMAGKYHHNGTVDDNDGIYLHKQAPGQVIQMQRSVVADVQDDGIDTLESDVLLNDVIVRDSFDKTISVFSGSVTLSRGLLVNSDIGIEAKGSGNSTADVRLDRTTIANVQHGVRAFDKGTPDPNVRITYDSRNSIIHVRPGGDPLMTDYDPADLHVNYTWVEEAWPYAGSGEGLVSGQPLFVDAAGNDYHLADGSPAIDAGDPAAGLDADDTRVELGYYSFLRDTTPSADFNGDDRIDADDIDLLCAALHAAEADLRFDLDQNGRLDSADVDFLVGQVLHSTYGDANLDGVFNSSDLVQVLQWGQYEDDFAGNSGWATGDWTCDGEFSSADLVAALAAGGYVA
jgi:hypothetical protein